MSQLIIDIAGEDLPSVSFEVHISIKLNDNWLSAARIKSAINTTSFAAICWPLNVVWPPTWSYIALPLGVCPHIAIILVADVIKSAPGLKPVSIIVNVLF